MLTSKSSAKALVTELMEKAGVQLDGSNQWDLQVKDERFYSQILRFKSLGLGESYMAGWWDCHRVDELIAKVLEADISDAIRGNLRMAKDYVLHMLLNYQTRKKAKIVAEKHYDLGNALYQAMLDKEMIYSCGYWHQAETLDQAQINKLELACQKLQLKPGMRLLDVGCGWGGLAKYAAQNYGVKVVGITISKEQKALADVRCKGLDVDIRLQDYREIHEKFDRIVSVGMFEHVGYKNYAIFMRKMAHLLNDNGLFLLHTIGNNLTTVYGDEWLTKYIFPHGMLPSISHIGKSIEGLFVMEDWHNFGAHYDKTLLAWHKNFNAHWDQLKSQYDEKFYRMWNYYLLACAGSFRARKNQLWQVLLSKKGIAGGFQRELIKI